LTPAWPYAAAAANRSENATMNAVMPLVFMTLLPQSSL
jgi:hypothetical protein